MITNLKLTKFKNFKDAEITFGPVSVLVGANATGKSNVRDALRFLNGIARGYNLAEIIGEKYGEGGSSFGLVSAEGHEKRLFPG